MCMSETSLLRVSKSAAVAEPAVEVDSVKEALKEFKETHPIIERYMSTALEPWRSDYLQMRPLEDASALEQGQHPVLSLQRALDVGDLREVGYASKWVEGRCFVLVACDIQGAGFVVGAGFAGDEELSKRLAAQQARSRLRLPSDLAFGVKEVKRCADAIQKHPDHAEARKPCHQAAESLEALEGYLRDVRVASFCPAGKAWMSAISAYVFHSRVLAASADKAQETAMALTGEVFYSRLRWALRVPPDEPHQPREWARTWQERAEAKTAWGGFDKPQVQETIELPPLGGEQGEEWLKRLLGQEAPKKHDKPDQIFRGRNTGVEETEVGARQRSVALREAMLRRRAHTARWGASAEDLHKERDLGYVPPEPDYFELQDEVQVSARSYAPVPKAQDLRRKELVGKLPVERIRKELGELLESKQVVMVSGGTGSGKSTQLPQFLIDDIKLKASNVVVTQPRRLAAISIAERVAWERAEDVGASVGYSVMGSAVRPRSSTGSVEFVTVGTLLRRALDDPLLQRCDTVVVDEVHERDLLTDFLLILLRDVLPKRPDMRLVLMSATLDVQTFTGYFGNCPVLEVPSGTLHPVDEVYLEDPYFKDFPHTATLLQAEQTGRDVLEQRQQAADQSAAPNKNDRGGGKDGEQPKQVPWWGRDTSDTRYIQLLEDTIRRLVAEVASAGEGGAILCFLPGWAEIRRLLDALRGGTDAGKIWALPLHSSLSRDKQQQVFASAPPGKVKVVLATNVAESSVTIDDVTHVVDAGLQRELTYDAARRMSSLDTVWVSKSNATQRKGRAGRVRPGKVLRLYSRAQLEASAERPAPEMQRCDLAQSCLQAIALGRDPRRFLAHAPDPPSKKSVEAAMDELVAIEAVVGMNPPHLLPIGEVLARLPVEPLLGRAALLGALLGELELTAALLVVAGGRSPFSNNRDEAVASQLEFCVWSDTFAAARALLAFEAQAAERGEGAAASWAKERNMSASALAMLSRSRVQLLREMRRAGLGGASPPVAAASSRQDAAGAEDADFLLETRAALGDEPDADVDDDMTEEQVASDRRLSAASDVDEAQEFLLGSVLASAFPANLAFRGRPPSLVCKTKALGNAMISPASVTKDFSCNGPTWCLYTEMQVSGGKGYLQRTTILENWQVGLFSGLKVKDLGSTAGRTLELDSWLAVKGKHQDTNVLLGTLRREISDGLNWQALVALHRGAGAGNVATASRDRAAALLRAAVAILSGSRPEEADAELLDTWKLPQPSPEELRRPAPAPRRPAPAPKAALAVAAAGAGTDRGAPGAVVATGASAGAAAPATATTTSAAVVARGTEGDANRRQTGGAEGGTKRRQEVPVGARAPSRGKASAGVAVVAPKGARAAWTGAVEAAAAASAKVATDGTPPEEMSVAQLKEWLRERGQKVSGSKAQLVQRVADALEVVVMGT
mmetsp:Transcript_45940/g.147634  ORF Transcript_45940/g.147634 Transcript_45940/m.147634 type:complete len:1425 (+) Transcript_45940:3-4277(+)